MWEDVRRRWSAGGGVPWLCWPLLLEVNDILSIASLLEAAAVSSDWVAEISRKAAVK